jgi:hypothetical protein
MFVQSSEQSSPQTLPQCFRLVQAWWQLSPQSK